MLGFVWSSNQYWRQHMVSSQFFFLSARQRSQSLCLVFNYILWLFVSRIKWLKLELCAAAATPPPTECRRRAGADFVTCSRHVVYQLHVASAVHNEAWTSTKAVRTMRACFAIALDTQMKHRRVRAKVFSWTILWKWKLIQKVAYRTSVQIRLIRRIIQWKISTACTVITAY